MAYEGGAARVAQVAGDDFGSGAVDEEAGAVKKLHERSCDGDAAFGEKDEPTAGREEFGHAFGRVRRGRVYGESAPVDHHLAVHIRRPGRRRAGHKLPIFIEDRHEKQPVQPRNMIGNQ